MGIIQKIRGISNNIFRIGLDGPQLQNGGTDLLQARNTDDSGRARIEALAAINDNELVTKKQMDSVSKPIIVKRQADTSSSIPNNTAVRGFVVVTTPGNGALIGGILFDDGSNSGLMEIFAPDEGRCLAITDALAGGTISFDPDSLYIWDDDGTAWVKIGDIGAVTGAMRVERFPITNAASQSSTFIIPANVRIFETRVQVVTPYSAGADIEVGQTGTVDLLQETSDNKATKADTYIVEGDTDWGGSPRAVLVTVSNTPAAGAGFVVVFFSSPNV